MHNNQCVDTSFTTGNGFLEVASKIVKMTNNTQLNLPQLVW